MNAERDRHDFCRSVVSGGRRRRLSFGNFPLGIATNRSEGDRLIHEHAVLVRHARAALHKE